MNFNKIDTAFTRYLRFKTGFLFFCAALFSVSAQATVGLTLQGKILKTNNTAVTSSNVQFRIQVRSPGAEDCLLYEETQTLDMSTSTTGLFALTIGTGTRPSMLIDGGYSLIQAFTNKGTIDLSATSPAACASGTGYTPASTDHRKLVYYFNDGSGWQTVPSMNITWTPFSIETLKVGGFQSTDLLRVVDGSGNPATAPSLTSAQATELMSIIAGSTTQYITPSSATFTAVPKYNGAVSASSDLTNKYYVDTAISNAISGSLSLPNTGTAGTYLKVTTDAQGRVTSGDASLAEADIPTLSTAGKVSGNAIVSGTISGSTSINTSGNLVTTGTVSALTNQSTNLRIYNGANYVQFNAPTLASSISFVLPSADGTSGQVLSTNGSGALSWATASGGATTLSGDVSGASTATSVDRLKGKDITAASISGQMMIYDGTEWVNSVISGDATIDYAGNLNLNTVPLSKGGTGATAFSGDRLMATNVTGTALEAVTCGLNEVISFTASGAIQCSSISSLITTSGFVDGGNSFSADATLGTNSNHALKFETNNTVAMTISNNGYVGIGTTDPQSALDLYSPNLGSDGDLTTNMTIGNMAPYSFPPKTGIGFRGYTDATSSTVYFSGLSGGKENATISNTAGYLSFSTRPNGKIPTERIRITSTGDIGIGTTSPGTSLDVTGAITSRPYGTTTGNTGQILLRELAASGTNTVTLRAPDALAASIAFTLPSADGTSGQVLSTDGAGVLSWITASGGGGSGGDFADGGNTFSADATLGTNSNHALGFKANNAVAMTISQDGSVGIGTTSPSSKLHIQDGSILAAGTTGAAPASGAGTRMMWIPSKAAFRAGIVQSTTWDNSYIGNYSAGFGQSTTSSGTAAFSAGRATSATGNYSTALGRGGIASGENSTAMGYYTTAETYAQTTIGRYNTASTGSAFAWVDTDPLFVIGNGASSSALNSAMTVLKNGSVGIGTASPGTSLDVSGAITARPYGTATGNTGQILLRELAASGTNTVTLRAPDAIASDIAFTLPSADGTSGQVLSTNGSGILSWTTASGGGSSSGDFTDGGNSFSADATLGTNSNHALKFETNNTVNMTISSAGNVGIGGAASATAKLTIEKTQHDSGDSAAQKIDFIGDITSAQGAGDDNSGLIISNSTGTSNGSTIGKIIGIDVTAGHDSGNLSSADIIGIKSLSMKSTGGTSTSAVGIYSEVGVWGGTSTPKVAGIEILSDVGSGSTTNQYGILISDVSVSGATVTNRYGLYMPAFTGSATNDFGVYQGGTAQKNYFAGTVGIGVPSPSASLDVSGPVHATGQIYSDAPVSDSGTPTATVDFNTGNTQVLQNVGSSTITLNNMKDGGSYLVIITDTTSRTYTFSGCTNSKFNPANASTNANTATLYNIVKVTIGGATHCFISWSSGYQ